MRSDGFQFLKNRLVITFYGRDSLRKILEKLYISDYDRYKQFRLRPKVFSCFMHWFCAPIAYFDTTHYSYKARKFVFYIQYVDQYSQAKLDRKNNFC